MKALLRTGLCIALGLLANQGLAQDIQFRASTPKSTAEIRPVSLNQPAADQGVPSFRPIVRAQAPDEITIQPLPKLEGGKEQPPMGKDQNPKPMPKDDGFTPPAPLPVTPSPVLGSLGLMPDDACCVEGEGGRWRRRWAGFASGDGCSPRSCVWASGEYLMWWQRSQNVPPLVTTSPAGTAFANAGVRDQASTVTLYDQTPNHTRGGGRFTLGFWIPHFCDRVGFETTVFFLGRQVATATFAGNGNPILARPFIDETGRQNAEIFSFPNSFSGSATITNFSSLWGIEGNLRYKWHCGPNYWVDFLAGYRHITLSEGINITEDNTFGPNTNSPGLRVVESESFRTRNLFNGGKIGLAGEWRCHDRWTIGWTTKVAMGAVNQTVNIDGTTTFSNAPAGLVNGTKNGALLATQTNIGKHTITHFAVVPEVGVTLGYDVTDQLRLFAGYNFLYISSVVRPGEQIDLRSNQTFRPTAANVQPTGNGPRVPAVLFRTNDYWAQGVTFGMLYRY